MTRRPSIVARLCTLLVATLASACGDDDRANDHPPSIDQRMRTLADCSPSDLEMLLPWTGPAFDDAGKLREPLPAGHVEAVVNGWPRRDPESTALRNEHGQITVAEVFKNPGLLGFQGFESVECDISASHTLWKDEASMLAFVTGAAHATAMASAPKMHHAFGGAHWTAERRTVAPTWKEGIARMVREYQQDR
jgi:hypothetical protein